MIEKFTKNSIQNLFVKSYKLELIFSVIHIKYWMSRYDSQRCISLIRKRTIRNIVVWNVLNCENHNNSVWNAEIPGGIKLK